MTFSSLQLEALEAAIASGTLEVRAGDKLVRYQNTADLIRARDLIRDQINKTARTSISSFCRD